MTNTSGNAVIASSGPESDADPVVATTTPMAAASRATAATTIITFVRMLTSIWATDVSPGDSQMRTLSSGQRLGSHQAVG